MKLTGCPWHMGYNVANMLAASIAGGEHKRRLDEPLSCIKRKICQISMQVNWKSSFGTGAVASIAAKHIHRRQRKSQNIK